jgi:hypothetical protein
MKSKSPVCGHQRPCRPRDPTSVLPLEADIARWANHVRNVPKSDMADVTRKKKSRPRAALNSNLMILDQAAINAGFDFRR